MSQVDIRRSRRHGVQRSVKVVVLIYAGEGVVEFIEVWIGLHTLAQTSATL